MSSQEPPYQNLVHSVFVKENENKLEIDVEKTKHHS